MSEYDFSNEARLTNDELAGKIAALAGLSDADVAQLFPTPKDRDTVRALRDAVSAAANQNEKVAALQERLTQIGKEAITAAKALLTRL